MAIDKSYNEWAASYDSNINKTRDLDHSVTQKVLEKYNFKTVLELGCGTGKNTTWLIDKADQIIGLDFSQKMLEKAKLKIQSAKVQFLQADINSHWVLPNNSFDLVTSSLVLEHIQDLNVVYRQAFDKLKKEGHFFICELHPIRQYKGSQAKFETESGTHKLDVFLHHLSDYIEAANLNGFELTELKEWFDDEDKKDLPRLISFVFKRL